MYRTTAEWLHAEAEKAGIPLRTLEQVQHGLAKAKAKKTKADKSLARLMLRHGRLTEQARAYVATEYPQN
jgi:hypothetical protein